LWAKEKSIYPDSLRTSTADPVKEKNIFAKARILNGIKGF
jgi:hypothetical protein